MLSRYLKMLVAIIFGNIIFWILTPVLPAGARHRLYQMDWGLVVDFWICLALYGLLEFTFKPKRNKLDKPGT